MKRLIRNAINLAGAVVIIGIGCTGIVVCYVCSAPVKFYDWLDDRPADVKERERLGYS